MSAPTISEVRARPTPSIDSPAPQAPSPRTPSPGPGAGAGPSSGVSIGLLILLGALTALPSLSLDFYLPALPAIARELGTAQSTAELTMTACLLGFAVGLLISGPISDAHGRRRPLLIGLALYVVVTLLCALVPSIWALLVLRLLQGATGAVGMVTGNAIIRDRSTGAVAAKMFATLMLANGAAPILGPVLGAQLLTFVDWRGVFVVLGLVGAVVLVFAVRSLPETLPVERRKSGGLRGAVDGFGTLLHDRALVGYTLGRALSASGLMAYLTASPFVFQQIYGLSPRTYSAVFALNSVGLIGMGQLGGRVVGRVGPSALLRIGVGICTGGAVVLLVAALDRSGLALVLLGVFGVVAGMGLVFPNSTALALGRHGNRAGAATGLLGVTQFFLQAVISPLTGLGSGRTAIPMALVVIACEVAAVVAIVGLTRHRASVHRSTRSGLARA
jgi:DHA1 family bicyclomycin/chloramphenicol resistance-like MFS transporter